MTHHADQTPAAELTPGAPTPAAVWSRRRFLQAGAATAAGAAVLAACGGKHNPTSRIGTVPTTTTLPAAEVTDVGLLRTLSSLEELVLTAYDTAASEGLLSASDQPVAAALRDQHQDTADAIAALTTERGGEPYECANLRMNAVYLQPAFQYILGSDRAAAALGIAAPATAIPPSDDQPGDTLILLNALESISAATYQAYVATLNDIELRAAAITNGVHAARRAALWGAIVNPDALVESSLAEAAAPATTVADSGEVPAEPAGPAPTVHAVSATFGQLGPVLIELGVADENGIRKKVNFETPSLNSLAYEYLGACTA